MDAEGDDEGFGGKEEMSFKCESCSEQIVYSTTQDILNLVYGLSKRQYAAFISHLVLDEPLNKIGNRYSCTRERIRQLVIHASNSLKGRARYRGIKISLEEIISLLRNNKELLLGLEKIEVYRIADKFNLSGDPVVLKEKFERKPEPIIEDDTPLSALGLSIRAHNCLINSGINTIGELKNMPQKDLFRIKNLGRKSLNEIAAALDGLSIKANFNPMERLNPNEQLYYN